jgi:hypothetical protein
MTKVDSRKMTSKNIRITLATIIIFLSACSIPIASFAEEDFIIRNLHTKVIDSSTLYVDVSFKLDIKNIGLPGKIFVTIQGVDEEGFEILANKMSGYFDRDQYASITEKRTFKKHEFEMVKAWRVKTAKKFDK